MSRWHMFALVRPATRGTNTNKPQATRCREQRASSFNPDSLVATAVGENWLVIKWCELWQMWNFCAILSGDFGLAGGNGVDTRRVGQR